jgi:hypothetical protein
MGKELIYNASNIGISFDPGTGILFCNWIGLQNEQLLKESGRIILQIVREKRCSKVLNDNTGVIGPWYHSVDWTASTWFPDMMDAGLRHFAWVCSKDIFAQLSAKRALPGGNVVKAFQKYDEALDWLTNVK